MNCSLLLPCAYLADQLAGDPEWFPHPVRLIGLAVSRGESAIRRPNQTHVIQLISGAALTFAVIGSTYLITAAFLRLAHRISRSHGEAAELLLAWTCLAARNLHQEATAVANALECGNLPLARQRLSRIVGRDTQHLDYSEISRALIETVAESASDGILAPLFYMALGGLPLAMAYKAINTLDSMIGHADHRYFYFGKIAARLDDAANFIPARLTALAIIAAASLTRHTDAGAAYRTWQRDAHKHKSLNAGHPESAISGALRVALGGTNTYAGEPVPAQRIGAIFSAPTPADARQAIRIISFASLLGLIFAVTTTALIQTRKYTR